MRGHAAFLIVREAPAPTLWFERRYTNPLCAPPSPRSGAAPQRVTGSGDSSLTPPGRGRRSGAQPGAGAQG